MHKSLCLILLSFSLFSCATKDISQTRSVSSDPVTTKEITTDVVSIVDTYSQGPFNTPLLIGSMEAFESVYGTLNTTLRSDNRAYLQVQQFFQNGGTLAYITRIPSLTEIGSKELKTGIYANEFFNILVLPGLTNLKEPEAAPVRKAALELVKERNAFLIIDPPAGMTFEATLAWRNATTDLQNQDHAAMYFPRLLVNDPAFGKKGRYLEPSGAMAGIISSTPYYLSPANIAIKNTKALEYKLSEEKLVQLYRPANGVSINPISDFQGTGILVVGARTLNGNSEDLAFITSRRIMSMIEPSIETILAPYLFAENNEQAWNSAKQRIGAYLTGVWTEGAIMGEGPSKAFTVEVGLGTTMTPEDILAGTMKVTVKIALNSPDKFVILNYSQQTGQK